jgi:hypothetical protein
MREDIATTVYFDVKVATMGERHAAELRFGDYGSGRHFVLPPPGLP